MWLIVGLGNPGKKYELTRHNIGFMVIDAFLYSLKAPICKSEHKAIVSRFQIDDEALICAKPQTYMNLSGESVVALKNYYKIELDQILVIHDDLDLEFGQMKLQRNRSAAGHNGIKSISELLGTQDYSRLKIGVGRPPHPSMDPADYVLQQFNDFEKDHLMEVINTAGDAIESFIYKGFKATENKVNGKRIVPPIVTE